MKEDEVIKKLKKLSEKNENALIQYRFATTYEDNVTQAGGNSNQISNVSQHRNSQMSQSVESDFSRGSRRIASIAQKSDRAPRRSMSGDVNEYSSDITSFPSSWSQFDIYKDFWTDYSLQKLFTVLHEETLRNKYKG